MAPRTIDLNAARAARAEARAGEDPITIAVGDDVYELPAEMPLAFLEAVGRLQELDGIADDDPRAAEAPGLLVASVRELVGSAVHRELTEKHGMSVEDLKDLVTGASAFYGVSLGESSASEVS